MSLKTTVPAQMSIPNGSRALSMNAPTSHGELVSNFSLSNRHTNNSNGDSMRYGENNNHINVNGHNGLPADIDLEGGTLLSIEENDEIDPEDNCKVQVTCYHILSADQTEERTVTRRRKLKVNCTQSLKRVEFSNGKGTKVEERTTIFNDVDAFREYANSAVGAHPALKFAHSRDDSANGVCEGRTESDGEISDVLAQTQNTFLILLNEKKEQLMLSFPELFTNLRTQPALFQRKPSTSTRTVVNADGSTTTHTELSKAFSSRYTCQETYLNGVRQETTTKFRAFMEYAGPEGGFCIRLNNADADDGELSESDDNEASLPFYIERGVTSPPLVAHVGITNRNHNGHDDVGGRADGDRKTAFPQDRSILYSSRATKKKSDSTQKQTEDVQSRISRSGISEIPDTVSALVTQDGSTQVPKLSSEPMKRREKAWHAVNELVESEGRYVQKLALLEKFREDVERERLLDRRQLTFLFSNIESLHRFHNDHLLPQLMDRRREWNSTQRISDVMRKQAPFLKMYSEYTNNYKRAVQTFEECVRKKKHFDEIVRRIEHMPECENLSLQSHLICPVQRVMRYQLLLKEYQKYLVKGDPDYSDTDIALTLVLEAASHANEMMRKLDHYRNVLEVQELLGNAIPLVSPSRELLMRVKLMKISLSTSKTEERLLFVFNDLFLLASERNSLMGAAKLKVRAIFDARYTQICEGDNFERENSFYLRGSDSVAAPLRCVELYCNSQAEKHSLLEAIWAIIDEANQRNATVKGDTVLPLAAIVDHNNKENSEDNDDTATSPTTSRFDGSKYCANCDVEFTWYSRGHVCIRCARRFCKKCFGRLRLEAKSNRLCADCLRRSVPPSHTETSTDDSRAKPVSRKRKNLLATPADELSDVIKAGYVRFRRTQSDMGTVTRYFVLRKNFCLYSYKTEIDACASAMMPMLGCEVTPGGPSDKLGFLMRHMHRVYHIQCTNESEYAEWLAALLLTANASLPDSAASVDGFSDGARTPKAVRRSMSVGDRIVHETKTRGSGTGHMLKPPPHLNAPYGRRSNSGTA